MAPTPRQRRDILRAFRFTESEDRVYQDGAVTLGEEFSEYVRGCLAIGHSMRQTQNLTRRAGA